MPNFMPTKKKPGPALNSDNIYAFILHAEMHSIVVALSIVF